MPCINTRTDGLAATSVGRPVPGYEVTVFSEDGARVPSGTSGEIAVRGGGLFSAYYAPWQPREQIMRDGWFFTGDLGRVDASGALHLAGRKKSVIFVAGVNACAHVAGFSRRCSRIAASQCSRSSIDE